MGGYSKARRWGVLAACHVGRIVDRGFVCLSKVVVKVGVGERHLYGCFRESMSVDPGKPRQSGFVSTTYFHRSHQTMATPASDASAGTDTRVC